jgi:hypothetical protein
MVSPRNRGLFLCLTQVSPAVYAPFLFLETNRRNTIDRPLRRTLVLLYCCSTDALPYKFYSNC